MNKTFKFIFFACITLILTYFLFSVFAVSTIFNVGNYKSYSKRDLIDNYEKNAVELFELQKYYNGLVPTDKVVEIEFRNDEEIARLEVADLNVNAAGYHEKNFTCSDLNINSFELDSISKSLSWTHKTLALLKTKLDRVNCISIKNSEPTKIGFQRSGFGMYFYNLFTNSIPDNMKRQYNDSCIHILYNANVVLEYGGGVYGPQCFSK